MAHEPTQATIVTPFKTDVCGIPLTTLVATCASLGLYSVSIIIIIASNCPFDREVSYTMAFLVVAAIAEIAMIVSSQWFQPKYRFDCSMLTLSLFYSGSAALIFFSLFMTSIDGLCKPKGSSSGSLFQTNVVANYFIWMINLIGLLFQVVAHYYYG